MKVEKTDILVIGGGAAGFFAAITAAECGKSVIIAEKTNKFLAKVAISGGGRCNVTNSCVLVSQLIKNYPRGQKALRNIFEQFGTKDTVSWFQSRNVLLKTESDGRMFPITDNSATIVQCLLQEAIKNKIQLLQQTTITRLEPTAESWVISTADNTIIRASRVIVATGGSPKIEGFSWLQEIGHRIEPPVPSLFTFNMPQNSITNLMGVVVNPARIKIIGTSLEQIGALLITHWGMSGPAILKLSAFGAKLLAQQNYQFQIQVNWLPNLTEVDIKQQLQQQQRTNKQLNKKAFETIPQALWNFFLEKLNLDANSIWKNISQKDQNRLLNVLMNDQYEVKGKTTFKEEFVTCGGVSLEQIDTHTMQSRLHKGLYFVGEVLDIDGITGGFNFQAAWSTGFIAGKSAAKSI